MKKRHVIIVGGGASGMVARNFGRKRRREGDNYRTSE